MEEGESSDYASEGHNPATTDEDSLPRSAHSRQEDSDDDEATLAAEEEWTSEEEAEADTHRCRQDLADLTEEISIKERLLDELEASEKRLAQMKVRISRLTGVVQVESDRCRACIWAWRSAIHGHLAIHWLFNMQAMYERKIAELSEAVTATEKERDRMLAAIDKTKVLRSTSLGLASLTENGGLGSRSGSSGGGEDQKRVRGSPGGAQVPTLPDQRSSLRSWRPRFGIEASGIEGSSGSTLSCSASSSRTGRSWPSWPGSSPT